MRKLKIAAILLTIGFSSLSFAANEAIFRGGIVNTALHQTVEPTKSLITIQGSQVRMVVFTTDNGYKISDTELGETIWTTVAPEVKQLCTDYVRQSNSTLTHDDLNLWLAQLLGLPSKDADKMRFVEFDIPVIQAYYGSQKPIGIFRPCTDPRIGPHADGSPICPKLMNVNDENIASEYKTWFINTGISSHTLHNGMPWTKYGYTYNWNEKASSPFGVSEFVVLKNTPITVIANPSDTSTPYITSEQYCGKN